MFFEAEAVAVEAAKREAQRAAECHQREAKQAEKILAGIHREKRKAEEEAAKSHRRFERDTARRYKTPTEHAQCDIRGIAVASAILTVAAIGRTAMLAARS